MGSFLAGLSKSKGKEHLQRVKSTGEYGNRHLLKMDSIKDDPTIGRVPLLPLVEPKMKKCAVCNRVLKSFGWDNCFAGYEKIIFRGL